LMDGDKLKDSRNRDDKGEWDPFHTGWPNCLLYVTDVSDVKWKIKFSIRDVRPSVEPNSRWGTFVIRKEPRDADRCLCVAIIIVLTTKFWV
jgi:hypothetical protein